MLRLFTELFTANIDVPEGGANGVIIATGGSSGGYTLYLDNGVPVYEYNFFGQDHYRVAGNEPLSSGRHTIVLDYKQSPIEGPEVTGGSAALSVDGTEVAGGDIAKVVPKRFSATETLDIGMDLGATVTKTYEDRAPFAFTGTIDDVNVELE
jgi:hypothetical protein